ncbi:MAG: hypothetical protein F9K46_05640 [Anaerolineae bacterium]|nr:MAG: hypothetical protein F9K46_05640 [Anaerolineae bacterium]
MSLPNFTRLALERFQLCNREIRLGTDLLYPLADAVYMTTPNLVKPTHTQLPVTWVEPQKQLAVKTSAGVAEFTRHFVHFTLVKPFALNRDGDQRLGSETPLDATDIEAAILGYYLEHPRLHTSTLDDLGFLSGGVVIRESEITTVSKDPKYPEFWAVLVTVSCTFKYGIPNSRA